MDLVGGGEGKFVPRKLRILDRGPRKHASEKKKAGKRIRVARTVHQRLCDRPGDAPKTPSRRSQHDSRMLSRRSRLLPDAPKTLPKSSHTHPRHSQSPSGRPPCAGRAQDAPKIFAISSRIPPRRRRNLDKLQACQSTDFAKRTYKNVLSRIAHTQNSISG